MTRRPLTLLYAKITRMIMQANPALGRASDKDGVHLSKWLRNERIGSNDPNMPALRSTGRIASVILLVNPPMLISLSSQETSSIRRLPNPIADRLTSMTSIRSQLTPFL